VVYRGGVRWRLPVDPPWTLEVQWRWNRGWEAAIPCAPRLPLPAAGRRDQLHRRALPSTGAGRDVHKHPQPSKGQGPCEPCCFRGMTSLDA